MEDNYIQLKKSDTLRLGIKDENGVPTGEFLEFNLQDIELPFRYQEMIEKDKKNKEWLKNQIFIINKRQDHKGKKLMSANEEAKMKALKEFYQKEADILDDFLGKNGVKKLLNGRALSWDTLDEIDKLVDEQIAPKLDLTMDGVSKKIKEKYDNAVNRNKEVLK